MGDMRYPGIQLCNVNPEITEHDVEATILTFIGNDSNLYRDGRPKIRLYSKEGEASNNVVISGILLPLTEIKRRLVAKYIRQPVNRDADTFIQIRDVDFGIKRGDNGLVKQRLHNLHLHLSSGQGYNLPSMQLVNPQFSALQLGGWTKPTNVITFNQNLRRTDTKMLNYPGEHLYYWKKTSTQTNIHYLYIFEALQAMMFLNLNKRFCNPPQCFINDGVCTYNGNDYLGINGARLNIQALLDEFGYIPKDRTASNVISETRLHRYFSATDGETFTKCQICEKDFNILGYGPDMTWFAVTCQCLITGAMTTWKGENFFRMIPNPDIRSSWAKFETVTTQRQKVVQFIKGITPLFEDVDDYLRSGQAAAIAEYKASKRELAVNRQIGNITYQRVIETDDEDKNLFYMVKITTKRTAVWCGEKQAGIHKITLIPPGRDVDYSSLEKVLPEHYAKPHVWMKARVYDINDLDDNTVSVIGVVKVQVAGDQMLQEGCNYLLVPKPPKTEIKALKELVSNWRRFEKVRKRQMLDGHITSLVFCKNVDYVSCRQRASFWILSVALLGNKELRFHDGHDSPQYEGADVYVPVQNKQSLQSDVLKRTGRILSIDEINGQIVLKIGLLLEPQWDIGVQNDVQLRIWVLKEGKVDPAEAAAQARNRQESEQDELPRKKPLITTYYVTRLPNLVVEDVDDVVNNWRERHEDYSLLDFLLQRKDPFILHPINPCFPALLPVNRDLMAEVNQNLNESQQLVVSNFLNRVLSIAIGPPGTGKTKTGAFGIIKLCMEESGTVIACCPSNFAANLLYERIVRALDTLGISLKVVRMLAHSREKLDTRGNQNLDSKDPNLLHVQVLQHPGYKSEKMLQIIEDADEFGLAALTKRDRKNLHDHKVAIGLQIMLTARVVVCTIGCASDSRLESLSGMLKYSGSGISALVIDECSLLTVPSVLPVLTINPSRIWLLGDPTQLPPTIKNESSKNACLDVSWMEILLLTPYIANGGTDAHSILNVQYRMAAEIGSAVSYVFYDGDVRSSDEVSGRRYHTMLRYRRMHGAMPELKKHNIGIYTYPGFHEQRDEGSISLWNRKECEIVEDLLKKLYASSIPMKDVVVIAMYDRQVNKLKERIAALGRTYSDVTVASVDSFQGKEAPVVIVSTVRSNQKHNVGFLREVRRTNVAISRAIDYLLLVTDVQTLMGSRVSSLVKLFNFIFSKGVERVECL